MLDESKSMNMSDASSSDLESGRWDLSDSELKPLLEDRICSGKQLLGSTVRCYFCSWCNILKKKCNSKTLVSGLLRMPSLLGLIYSDDTFPTVTWGRIWFCYVLGKHQQNSRCIICNLCIYCHFLTSTFERSFMLGVIYVVFPLLITNRIIRNCYSNIREKYTC